MANVLDKIVADKKKHVAACQHQVPLSTLEASVRGITAPRDFFGALKAAHDAKRTALICEIKKASPSAGLIRPDFNAAELAKTYERAGASCLSILTDTPYFQGADIDLIDARAAVNLPVLRKDFMIDPYQIVESRALGADCVLLIMACLSDAQMRELLELATSLDLSILIEIHDEEELRRYLALGVTAPKAMLGINNRNLKTLEIDLDTTRRLAELAAPQKLLVGESGIKTRADIDRLKKQADVHCFLVGENLLKQKNVAAATSALLKD